MTTTQRFAVLAAAVLALSATTAIGFLWGRSHRAASPPTPASATAERRILYWYDPMVPDQHFDKPGKSPYMDMDLVPRYADGDAREGVAIAPGARQNLGMRTVVARRGALESALTVPGTIGWDLRRERVVSARVDGIVERLHVRAPYEQVRAGQPLASVLAPAWGTAIAEAQALGNAGSGSARALRDAARQRLRALGMPPGAAASGGRITLASPVDGVVSEIGAREGQSTPAGTLLFRVNGTDTVWLEASVPQGSATDVRPGTPVEAAVDAWPGKRFEGRVESLLPQVDTGSRTQRARIVLDNPGGLLSPGMFAQVTLRPAGGAEHPLIPTDALIGGGAQARVIVLDDDGRFLPVSEQAGRSAGGMTEILAGLRGGERVVSSGQFLIDSEANLSGALGRLAPVPSGTAPASAPDADPHDGHAMHEAAEPATKERSP